MRLFKKRRVNSLFAAKFPVSLQLGVWSHDVTVVWSPPEHVHNRQDCTTMQRALHHRPVVPKELIQQSPRGCGISIALDNSEDNKLRYRLLGNAMLPARVDTA